MFRFAQVYYIGKVRTKNNIYRTICSGTTFLFWIDIKIDYIHSKSKTTGLFHFAKCDIMMPMRRNLRNYLPIYILMIVLI